MNSYMWRCCLIVSLINKWVIKFWTSLWVCSAPCLTITDILLCLVMPPYLVFFKACTILNSFSFLQIFAPLLGIFGWYLCSAKNVSKHPGILSTSGQNLKGLSLAVSQNILWWYATKFSHNLCDYFYCILWEYAIWLGHCRTLTPNRRD